MTRVGLWKSRVEARPSGRGLFAFFLCRVSCPLIYFPSLPCSLRSAMLKQKSSGRGRGRGGRSRTRGGRGGGGAADAGDDGEDDDGKREVRQRRLRSRSSSLRHHPPLPSNTPGSGGVNGGSYHGHGSHTIVQRGETNSIHISTGSSSSSSSNSSGSLSSDGHLSGGVGVGSSSSSSCSSSSVSMASPSRSEPSPTTEGAILPPRPLAFGLLPYSAAAIRTKATQVLPRHCPNKNCKGRREFDRRGDTAQNRLCPDCGERLWYRVGTEVVYQYWQAVALHNADVADGEAALSCERHLEIQQLHLALSAGTPSSSSSGPELSSSQPYSSSTSFPGVNPWVGSMGSGGGGGVGDDDLPALPSPPLLSASSPTHIGSLMTASSSMEMDPSPHGGVGATRGVPGPSSTTRRLTLTLSQPPLAAGSPSMLAVIGSGWQTLSSYATCVGDFSATVPDRTGASPSL
jgi:hypothetical protein